MLPSGAVRSLAFGMQRFRYHRRWLRPVLVCLCSTAGCDTSAVSWNDATAVTSPRMVAEPIGTVASAPDMATGDTSSGEWRLIRDLLHETNGVTTLAALVDAMPESRVVGYPVLQPIPIAESAAHALGVGDAPGDSASCAASVRVALAPGRGRVAVWWSRRAQGRVWLLAAWRDTLPSEGRLTAWRGPIVVDTLDRGARTIDASFDGGTGCERAAPSVAIDDRFGYVHVGYALTGPEGAGVFYAHQMDPRAAFEPPVAIVYGESPTVARVAAQGGVVAVAYEDPNSGARRRVALALSTTSGHSFTERVNASSEVVASRDPFVVLRGRAIGVGWTENTGNGVGTFRTRRAIVRR